jgi:hypothetical protein
MDLAHAYHSVSRTDRLLEYWDTAKAFATKHRKVLLIIALVVASFYWFQIRPIRVSNYCAVESSANARALLQSKAAVSTDPAKQAAYAQLAERNMYLRSDYESFFTKCLRRYGFGL